MSDIESPPGRQVLVARRRACARHAVAFDLVASDGRALPDWQPGSHIELLIPHADGDLVRQYSLCGSMGDRHQWRIVVHRELRSRGGSATLCDQLVEGRTLYARGPRNNFPLVPSPRILFLAGGIGITPLLPMAVRAQAAGYHWHLIYLARTEDDMNLLEDIRQLPSERVTLHCSADRGRFDLARWTRTLSIGDAVYACGPLRLLDDLELLHAPASSWRLHLERFENPNLAVREHLPFEVVLAKSGRSLRVGSHESILEVLLREGLDIECSCREGVCGSCEQRVLHGVPDHRDAVLTAEERRKATHMMVCVSRAMTPSITLDI